MCATPSTFDESHYYAYDYESRISPLARWGKAALDARKLGAVLRRIPRRMARSMTR